MEFSNVKAITIPEGDVYIIRIGGVIVWTKNTGSSMKEISSTVYNALARLNASNARAAASETSTSVSVCIAYNKRYVRVKLMGISASESECIGVVLGAIRGLADEDSVTVYIYNARTHTGIRWTTDNTSASVYEADGRTADGLLGEMDEDSLTVALLKAYTWPLPQQSGSVLTVRAAYGATQSGTTLTLE